MAILNYTTTISTEKTAMEIQTKLVKVGAQAVLCEFDSNGVMCAMSFRIATAHGVVFFRLPAQLDGVLNAIKKDRKITPKFKTREQAARVAWRILKDWIEAQLAIIEAGMAEMVEVFLPYAQSHDGSTLYQSIKNGGFKAIGHNP